MGINVKKIWLQGFLSLISKVIYYNLNYIIVYCIQSPHHVFDVYIKLYNSIILYTKNNF